MTTRYWNGGQSRSPWGPWNGVNGDNVVHARLLKAMQHTIPPFGLGVYRKPLGISQPVYDGDVGYDLVADQSIEIGPIQRSSLHRWRGRSFLFNTLITSLVGEEPPPSFGVIRTGVHVEMPEGYWGAILPRSSSNKLGMFIPFSVIDNGYRGELFPMVHNLSDKTIRIEQGKKFAQFIMFPMVVLPLLLAESLSESTRGIKGFGSTGG